MTATIAEADTDDPAADEVAAVRAFNRFYTGLIGVLGEGIVDSPYSLTEARVLFELAQAEATEVVDLRSRLQLDAGYLSRIVSRFESEGLVERSRSPEDGRRVVLRLTSRGRATFASVDRSSADEIGGLLARLDAPGRRRLLGAMRTIEGLFAAPSAPSSYVLRPPDPGDLGWIVERHGALYAAEYGWNDEFEAFVAGTVGAYVAGRDPAREAVWIAEVDGERAGCVGCVREDDETARLRWLLVEPSARGGGIGARLVDECLRFARRSGYRRITLWTYDVLADARRIYERAGFTLDDQRPEHAFGHDLTQQNWSRPL
jgi:DNA-binding MarR family transcriptional regulator/GNAT superfamily N-acetyltransferase